MNNILEALPKTLKTETHSQVTEYFDVRQKQLINCIDLFLNFDGNYENLSMQQIETLAPFFGFDQTTFWAKSWSKKTKSKLLKGVYSSPYLWNNNGSYQVLNYVFSCFDLEAQLQIDGGFTVDVSIVDTDVISAGNTYLLLVKDLAKNQFLVSKIMSVFFPIGFQYRTVEIF